jgi:peptide/nickel transport system substrate-binding protein
MNHVRLALAILAGALALFVSGAAHAEHAGYGGTLVVGVNGDPGTLDKTVGRSGALTQVCLAMCLQLYQVTSNHGTPQLFPVLAASQPAISTDGLSYTVPLRQGIQFNDGTPLDAQAVIATYQRFTTYPGTSQATAYINVASVTATGQYTVVFRLKGRDSSFHPNIYVYSPTALATEGASFAQNPIGAGPFMLDHYVPGDSITVVKSPYWYKRGAVHLDKIVYKVLPNAVVAAAALLAGDIQVDENVGPAQLQALQQDPNVHVHRHVQIGAIWDGVIINIGNRNGCCNPAGNSYQNVGSPLASSPKLRQAFEEAIDRDALNKVAFGGLYQPICTAIPPANAVWYEATRFPCTPYDPNGAKRLVAASGFANPTVHLAYGNAEQLTAAEVIQAEEAAVGIHVIIDTYDAATLNERLAGGAFDTVIRGGLSSEDFDPDGQISRYLSTLGDHNYSGYSNPRMDYVLANARKALGFKARALDYRIAQQIAGNDRPIIYLYTAVSFSAYRADVIGIDQGGSLDVPNAQLR